MQNFNFASRLVIVLVAVVLAIGSSPAFGCAICKYSPDGQFGFCRWGFDRGWNECTSTVRNQFTGATDCDLEDSTCGTNACYWTDSDGNCILAY
jgi:hypothetical protein